MTAPRPEAVELLRRITRIQWQVGIYETCSLNPNALVLIDAALTAAREDERNRILALIENPGEDDDGIWQSTVINGRAACEHLARAIREDR